MNELVKPLTALRAKQCGFDWKVNDYLHVTTISVPAKLEYHEVPQDFNKFESLVSMPSQSILQRWLRDIHKIDLFVKKGYGYEWYVHNTDKGDGTYNSYEDALESGLLNVSEDLKISLKKLGSSK